MQERHNGRKQKAACLGYIGGQGDANLGDEAMLDAAQRLLPKAQLIPIGFPRQEKRLEKWGLSGKRYFNSVILGGGTLINEYIWAEQVQTALRQGLPLWSLGTGVGSCGFGHSEQVNLRVWKALLPDFQKIGVRGPLSQRSLQQIGIERVQVIGDLALSLAQERAVSPSRMPCFALNTTAPPARARDQGDYSALQEMEETLCELVRQGWQPIPIAMHRDDVAPLRQLLERVGQSSLPIPILQNAEQFFQRVQECHFTLAVRLHTAVLSCCVGVPPLMLGYRNKCLDFMLSMDLEDWHIGLEHAEPGEILTRTRALVNQAESLRPLILQRALHWKQRLADYIQS